MHSRILLGVGAWLVGAAAATGGSLLAVSALGQGMIPAAGQQLSVEAVNRALSRESVERAAAPQRVSPIPSTEPSSPVSQHPSLRSQVTRHPSPPPSLAPADGTVLTSQGGTVVAACEGGRAYLVSWSPQQGFESSRVVRGPAAAAQASFISRQVTVTMVVSCDAGVPTASVSAIGGWGGDE